MTRFAMLGGMPVPPSPCCEYFYTLSATGQGSPSNYSNPECQQGMKEEKRAAGDPNLQTARVVSQRAGWRDRVQLCRRRGLTGKPAPPSVRTLQAEQRSPRN